MGLPRHGIIRTHIFPRDWGKLEQKMTCVGEIKVETQVICKGYLDFFSQDPIKYSISNYVRERQTRAKLTVSLLGYHKSIFTRAKIELKFVRLPTVLELSKKIWCCAECLGGSASLHLHPSNMLA